MSAGKFLNSGPGPTQTQTCERTQTEAAAAAEPPKVSDGEGLLALQPVQRPPHAGRSPHASSATLCDAHILQDKTSSDTCSISPYAAGFLPWGAGGMNGPIPRVTTTKSFVQLKSSDLTPKMSLS